MCKSTYRSTSSVVGTSKFQIGNLDWNIPERASFNRLIVRILRPQMSQRPTIFELIQDPYFSQVHDPTILSMIDLGNGCSLKFKNPPVPSPRQMTVHGALPIETNLRKVKGSHESNVSHHAKQGFQPIARPGGNPFRGGISE